MKRTELAVDRIRDLVGNRITLNKAVRDQHSHGESFHPSQLPDAVVFVVSTAEVSEIVKICAQYRTPIIPFGTGTSLEGHVTAPFGGISIDLSQMNKVLRVSPEDLDCTIQAGVTRKQLNHEIRDTGLFFPIDPGADASLGGMAATRASGTNAVRYGTMRENVLGLQVVLADGRVIQTGTRAKKSAAGYDLTKLFVGSEGTLGVFVEVTLRLHGVPEVISSAVCSFSTLEGAVNTVIRVIQMGIPIARVELLDDVQMDAVNRYSKLTYPALSTLFFEFHGSEGSVREQVDQTRAIAAEYGGGDFIWATAAEERAKLWQARHTAYYAAIALRPGCKGWSTDVCVPISRLAECILETKQDIQNAGLLAPIVGHVGDGNFHLAHVLDPNSPDEIRRAYELNTRLVRRALAMDGTCTGEHGVGVGKIDFLVEEAGEAVNVMREIKRALDPNNIMNPGKILRMDAPGATSPSVKKLSQ